MSQRSPAPQKLDYLLRFSVTGVRDQATGRPEKYTALRNLLACATSEADGLHCGMSQDMWAALAGLADEEPDTDKRPDA